MSKEKLNIYQKLHAVMKQISYVQKEDKKVNNQYKFVSHDAVTSVVRAALVDHDIMAIPTITDHRQDGNRTVVNLSIDFINIDNPEEKVTTVGFGYGIDQQDKGPGKAYSYAYKYALLKMFALETGDDPERDNINHTPEPTPEEKQKNLFVLIRNDLNKASDDDLPSVWDNHMLAISSLPEAGKAVLQGIWDKRTAAAEDDEFPADG